MNCELLNLPWIRKRIPTFTPKTNMFCFINFSAIFQNFSDFTLGTPHGPVACDDFGSSAHGKVHQRTAPHIRPWYAISFTPCVNIHIAAGASRRTYTGIPTLYISMHREPNIIRIARALYHRKPIKKKTRECKYIFLIIINSLRNNGWAACAQYGKTPCMLGLPVRICE